MPVDIYYGGYIGICQRFLKINDASGQGLKLDLIYTFCVTIHCYTKRPIAPYVGSSMFIITFSVNSTAYVYYIGIIEE